MFKLIVFGIAIGLAGAQNFQQTTQFGQREILRERKPELINIQPQRNPVLSALRQDEISDSFRQTIAHANRRNDQNIVEINNTPLTRQQPLRSRLERIRLQEEGLPEAENIPNLEIIRRQPVRQPLQQRQPIESSHILAREEKIDEQTAILLRKQAENAHYSFDSSVQDSINDQAQIRQETRDGLALTGLYAYSDGFFRRTVHYKADENGYRVTKEEIEPIGDGPIPNPKGKADVHSSLSGEYSITADDIRDTRVKDPSLLLRRPEVAEEEQRNKPPLRKQPQHRFEAGRI